MKHLVIGDAHAKPGVSNNRFEWLASWALDERPDVIIDMGDWADMPSLSSYDVGKLSFEGRRYSKDVEAARNARERFNNEFKSRKWDRPKYKPRLVALGGNHCEGRINRVLQNHPELSGSISYKDLGAEEYGWEYVPYGKIININGISYSHHFPSGILGRPIGGEYAATTLLKKMHVSCTAAHTHLRDFSERTRADGKKILGLVAGCYFEHQETYAATTSSMWWRGLVLCNDVHQGNYDPFFRSIKSLRKEYS